MVNQNMEKKRGPSWARILVALAVIVGLICATDLPSLIRRLPSDEEMIEHFYKHRADFERLVQIYREDLSVPIDVVGTLLPTPEVKAIMDRVNVSYISGDQVPWIPPDPYSRDPDFQSVYMKILGHNRSEMRRFSGVILGYVHPKVLRFEYLAPVFKRYYYTPLVPRMRDGKLHFPIVTLLAYGDGAVVQSLNTSPPDLGPFECAYRQIEPHWFVRMYQYRDN